MDRLLTSACAAKALVGELPWTRVLLGRVLHHVVLLLEGWGEVNLVRFFIILLIIQNLSIWELSRDLNKVAVVGHPLFVNLGLLTHHGHLSVVLTKLTHVVLENLGVLVLICLTNS